MSKKKNFVMGLKTGLPIVFGFIPVGIAYAMMAREAGLTILETCLMSLTVFAGASQMMAAGMIAKGAGILAIIITTFILNLRHVIMSMCVFNKMDDKKNKLKYPASFGVTDESFAVFTQTKKENSNIYFFLGLVIISYSAWNVGSLIGAIASEFLPEVITISFGIALYAMFIGLLMPGLRGNLKLTILVIFTAIISFVLNKFIDSSWAIVISTLVSAFIGIYFVDLKEDNV